MNTPEQAPEKLPNENYHYGEQIDGVYPVFGAHKQLLWYHVPGLSTRFTNLAEAHGYLQLLSENKRLREVLTRACIALRVKGEDSLADDIYKSAQNQ